MPWVVVGYGGNGGEAFWDGRGIVLDLPEARLLGSERGAQRQATSARRYDGGRDWVAREVGWNDADWSNVPAALRPSVQAGYAVVVAPSTLTAPSGTWRRAIVQAMARWSGAVRWRDHNRVAVVGERRVASIAPSADGQGVTITVSGFRWRDTASAAARFPDYKRARAALEAAVADALLVFAEEEAARAVAERRARAGLAA